MSGELDDLESVGEGVAPVDGEDKTGMQRGVRGFKGGDRREDGRDIVCFGESSRGHGAGGGA